MPSLFEGRHRGMPNSFTHSLLPIWVMEPFTFWKLNVYLCVWELLPCLFSYFIPRKLASFHHWKWVLWFCFVILCVVWFGLVDWLCGFVVVVVGWLVCLVFSFNRETHPVLLVGWLVIVGFCCFWFGVCVVLFCVTSDCLQSLVNTLCCLTKRHTVLGSRI